MVVRSRSAGARATMQRPGSARPPNLIDRSGSSLGGYGSRTGGGYGTSTSGSGYGGSGGYGTSSGSGYGSTSGGGYGTSSGSRFDPARPSTQTSSSSKFDPARPSTFSSSVPTGTSSGGYSGGSSRFVRHARAPTPDSVRPVPCHSHARALRACAGPGAALDADDDVERLVAVRPCPPEQRFVRLVLYVAL